MRIWRALIAIMLVFTATAWAQEAASDGTVAAYAASEGTIKGNFARDAALESRDIFTIVQKGRPIGEAMVVKVGNGTCTLLPKGNLKGVPRMGDVLRFARHAEMPVDGTEGWKVFTTDEFSACVPLPMRGPEARDGSNSQGTYKALLWATVDPVDETGYLVSIARYTLNKLSDGGRWAERSIEDSLQEMATARGATLNWTRRVRGLEYPACDFELQDKDGVTIRGRKILVHLNMYSAFAVARNKGISGRAWKFLNSFKITPKD